MAPGWRLILDHLQGSKRQEEGTSSSFCSFDISKVKALNEHLVSIEGASAS